MSSSSKELRKNKFLSVAMVDKNPKWEAAIKRERSLEVRQDEIRSAFWRDYCRILHSLGYRRLKHKTQVFFCPENDHICTRIEHVNHVESASYTIAQFLGLNTELTKAISIGHDIGHAPFGHLGEEIIKEITQNELHEDFWHEKNGLHFVDEVELLPNSEGKYLHLGLTYAVRDGIISHCGEINQNSLKPRDEAIDLSRYIEKNQYSPYTWEGCVVKLSDKIAYLGRDIEDAKLLNIIGAEDVKHILDLATDTFDGTFKEINTTSLMHYFIIDLCKNSSIENGLKFSDEAFKLMKTVMNFNSEKIYKHPRLDYYKKYASDIINSIYKLLVSGYDNSYTRVKLESMKTDYPIIIEDFIDWIIKYWDIPEKISQNKNYPNDVYKVCDEKKEYQRAVIDYISGMTDDYAKRMYQNLCTFR